MRRFRDAGLLASAFAVALALSTFALAGCGDSKPSVETEGRLLTIVRVEEKIGDGSWAPVSGANVVFEIFGSQNIAANIARYQLYEDVTDEYGIAAVLRGAENKTASQIGMVFAQVEHMDGRTQFKRVRPETDFDFETWFRKFSPADVPVDEIIAQLCETALDFPNCAEVLKESDLKAWGAGLLIRLR